MKRFLPLFIACLTTAFVTMAGTGGPDNYGYTWADSDEPTVSYGWIDITGMGTQVNGLADDNFIGPFPFPISFQYYWMNPSTFCVGSNGYISLDGCHQVSSGADGFAPTPTADNKDNLIAPLMCDLNFGTSDNNFPNPGQCWYWSNNTDSFIVSFIDVPFWTDGAPGEWDGSNSFQIIFNGADNSIRYNFMTQNGIYNAGYVGTSNPVVIGIEDPIGGDGLQVDNDLPTVPYSVEFTWPSMTTAQINDVKANWNLNSMNAGHFGVLSIDMQVETGVFNQGNVDITGDIDVNTKVYANNFGGPGAVLFDSDITINGMTAGQATGYTHTPLFDADGNGGNPGSYWVISDINNPGDDFQANNMVRTELVMLDTTGVSEVTLKYTDGLPDPLAPATLGFEGGGVHYMPPFYPVDITQVTIYTEININAAQPDPFRAKIYADDGPNGTPGTLLFDSLIASADVKDWVNNSESNDIMIPTPITIASGGFYVSFESQQQTQNLATLLLTEQLGPFSQRTYEVLSGAFGVYRDNLADDFFIHANVTVPQATVVAPTASFGQSDITVCTGEDVDFFSTTLGATSYLWDFPSGSPAVSSSSSESVSWADAGTYTITFTATNSAGSDMATSTLTVEPTATADFSASADTVDVTAGESIMFTNSSVGANTYLWQVNGVSVDTNANYTYTPAAGDVGDVIITLIVSGACGQASKADTVHVTMINDIKSLKSDFLNVYPNPTANVLVVETGSVQAEVIEIYNMLGALVKTIEVSDNKKLVVDVANFDNGTYFIKAIAGTEISSSKFTVSH